jgi:hypothetical protein
MLDGRMVRRAAGRSSAWGGGLPLGMADARVRCGQSIANTQASSAFVCAPFCRASATSTDHTASRTCAVAQQPEGPRWHLSRHRIATSAVGPRELAVAFTSMRPLLRAALLARPALSALPCGAAGASPRPAAARNSRLRGLAWHRDRQLSASPTRTSEHGPCLGSISLQRESPAPQKLDPRFGGPATQVCETYDPCFSPAGVPAASLVPAWLPAPERLPGPVAQPSVSFSAAAHAARATTGRGLAGGFSMLKACESCCFNALAVLVCRSCPGRQHSPASAPPSTRASRHRRPTGQV